MQVVFAGFCNERDLLDTIFLSAIVWDCQLRQPIQDSSVLLKRTKLPHCCRFFYFPIQQDCLTRLQDMCTFCFVAICFQFSSFYDTPLY